MATEIYPIELQPILKTVDKWFDSDVVLDLFHTRFAEFHQLTLDEFAAKAARTEAENRAIHKEPRRRDATKRPAQGWQWYKSSCESYQADDDTLRDSTAKKCIPGWHPPHTDKNNWDFESGNLLLPERLPVAYLLLACSHDEHLQHKRLLIIDEKRVKDLYNVRMYMNTKSSFSRQWVNLRTVKAAYEDVVEDLKQKGLLPEDTGSARENDADGWRLGPSTETPGGRVHVFGMNEDEMLSRLYTHLADWLHVVKKIVKKEKLDLSHYLEECLGKACRDRNVPDSSERTAGKLLPHGRDLPPGPDLLLFFFKKCPHSRDAFLRGELPPYPWRMTQIQNDNPLPSETARGVNGTPAKGKKYGPNELSELVRELKTRNHMMTAKEIGKQLNRSESVILHTKGWKDSQPQEKK